MAKTGKMNSSSKDEVQIIDMEILAVLQDDSTNKNLISFDQNLPLNDTIESESDIEYEFETDNDLQNNDETEPDLDAIVNRAVHHIENKKRNERVSSFDHGFDFPFEVRKRIVSDNSHRKMKKSAKENKATNLTVNENKRIREKSTNLKLNKRFARIPKKLGLNESQDRKRGRNQSVSTKKTTHTKTELASKRVRSKSPVVPHQNVLNENHTQTKTETDNTLRWNVRQNSFSDLLLNHFDMISQTDKIIKLKCKLCGERKQPISIVFGNNSNLKSHLKAVSNLRGFSKFKILTFWNFFKLF